jgi:hypothetical protein
VGAVCFSLDPNLFAYLRRGLPLSIFVETGTFYGETTRRIAPHVDKVYTVELAKSIFAAVHPELQKFPNVVAVEGDSAEALRSLRSELEGSSVLYWLDAHWCGDGSAGAGRECPVLHELEAISNLNERSVVLIDDARYFLAPPPSPHQVADWPRLCELTDKIREVASDHGVWVINDVVIVVPHRIEEHAIEYGRNCGIDLLALAGRPSRPIGTE